MANISTQEIADYFVNKLETVTVDFINKRANKIYCASYRSGAYGRIFSKFIKDNYPTNLNLNGGSTSIAITITDLLQKKGYDFKNNSSIVTFKK